MSPGPAPARGPGRRRLAAWALALAATGALIGPAGHPPLAGAQGREVHGENSVFAVDGVAVAWGVLKAPVEDDSVVVVRIDADRGYAYAAVEAVDPFAGARQPVLLPHPLGAALDVRSPRRLFADFPRREIHLYRTAEDRRAARRALTIYYLGVPDTTPEFTSEAALTRYLAAAVLRARAAGGGTPP